MKFAFRKVRLSAENKQRLDFINSIIREYQQAGYKLTLRQLYYQLVSRDVVPNKVSEYDKLSVLLREGRMGGVVDWNAIEDRLRIPKSPASWDTPADVLKSAAAQFQMPRMKEQETYLEVWVEKDALSGVLSRVTRPYHIPILVNRGYSSASAMYDAFMRFSLATSSLDSRGGAKRIKVLYLGDFDPSGIDMVRDIEQRIREFFIGYVGGFEKWVVGDSKRPNLHRFPELWRKLCIEKLGVDFEVISVALTRDQIDQYQPPPNPAKRTDTRFAKFEDAHGSTSWEVDALPPEVLNQILTDEIEAYIDRDLYDKIVEEETSGRDKLMSLIPYVTGEKRLRRR